MPFKSNYGITCPDDCPDYKHRQCYCIVVVLVVQYKGEAGREVNVERSIKRK